MSQRKTSRLGNPNRLSGNVQLDFPTRSINREFYEELRALRPSFQQVDQFVITVEDQGKGFVVKKGQTARIVCIDGPQIADICLYNANDYREHLWNDQTLNREGAHLTTYSRLWGNMPRFRPLMTIIEDTVENKPTHPGSRHHAILTAHCNPYFWYEALKDEAHPFVTSFNCHLNLSRAVKPFGLGPEDLHDNLNLFQKTYIDLETSRCTTEESDARQGDYVEFYAEIDILMAISICPCGSDRVPWNEKERDVRPLGVNICQTGIQPLEFEVLSWNME